MAGDMSNWFANLFQSTPSVQAAGDVIHPYTLRGNLVPENSMVPSGPFLPDPPSVQAALAAQSAPFLSEDTTQKLNYMTPFLAMQAKQALTFPRPQAAPAAPLTHISPQMNQPTALSQIQALQELMKRYQLG